MNVYRRYFRVENGPLIDVVREATAVNKKARKEYALILDDLGAKCDQWYQIDERMVGLIFENEPDRNLYKKVKHGWWPKKNNKKAKAICERLNAVKTHCINDCLKVVGLSHGPAIFGGGRCYYPTLIVIPSDSPVCFISVPWYDEDPEKLKAYTENKNHHSSNMDAILWKPSDEMIEVKKWETDRAVDEWNESVKAEKKAA